MKKIVAVVIALLVCLSNVYGANQSPSYSIKINIAAQILRLYSKGAVIKEYPIAVGKPTSKTPIGNFKVINKVVNPYWNNKGKIVAPGPANPLGIRWIGLNAPNGVYGIHGNNVPKSIGTFASGGCIRMNNRDVEELYSIISVGTPVQIVYEDVELRQDMYSEATALVFHADVYKRKSAKDTIKNLPTGSKTISKELLNQALKLADQGVKSTTVIADSTSVLLNGQYMTSAAYIENEQIYAYYLPALELLGLDLDTITELNIPVIEKESFVYINLSQAVPKLGGTIHYDRNNNNVNLSLSVLKINGRYLSSYKGNFDKIYSIDAALFKPFEGYKTTDSQETTDLKELSKLQNWILQIDSLNKLINIQMPAILTYADKSVPTLQYEDSTYIDVADLDILPDMGSMEFSVHTIKQKKYYELNEILQHYSYHINRYFTEIEVIEFIKSEV